MKNRRILNCIIVAITVVVSFGFMTQGVSAVYDYDYDYDSNTVCFGDCSCPWSPCSVPGCTDSSALNYNPSATIDDGTCQYPPAVVPGCMDSSALNYNPSATLDDGSCTYPPVVIPGCTNPSALNYNPSATVDDGTCQYPPAVVPGCMDSSALNYNPSATVDDGTCTWPPCMIFGCTDSSALNYEPTANVDDGSCTYPPVVISGCMDSSALNYNSSATVDDGTCQYPSASISGCMDGSALNYNPVATIDDGTCTYPSIEKTGCTNPAATNYDPTATIDSGNCQFSGAPSFPSLRLIKSVEQDFTNPGGTITYTVLIQNIGSGTARDIVLTDVLPNGFSYVDETLTGEWILGDIQRNEDKSISFDVLVSEEVEAGLYTNTAELTSSNYSTISDDAEIDVRETTVKGEEAFPELVIEKTVNKDSVDSGTYVFYTIKVTNNGDADAINLVVEDDLPEGFIDDSNSSKVVWEVPLLEKNGGVWTKTFPIYVSQSVESGSYENIAMTKAENHSNEVKDSAIVRVGTLPHTGVNSFIWFILGGFTVLLIGILGLVSIFTKKYRKAIQFVVFSGLIVGALVALSYPFLPAIKYNLSIPVVNSEEIKDIEEAIDIEGDWLIIPSIGVEIPIVLGQDDSALENGAWLLPDGSTPDSGGNTALAAHRFKYKPPHKETFYLLDKVKSGDSFYIYWQGKKYTYTVTSSNVVEPEAIEVLNQTEKSIVTLITCTPLFSDKNRLVVVGELVI